MAGDARVSMHPHAAVHPGAPRPGDGLPPDGEPVGDELPSDQGDERTGGDGHRPPPSRLDRVVAVTPWALGLAALVAAAQGLADGWRPIGDDAYFAVRSWDVFSANIPLLGTASSASEASNPINHPGPLQFDLLAAPVRLFGHAAGSAYGSAAINALSLGLAGWLARRRLGTTGAALVLAAIGLLVFSMGATALYDPWGPIAVTLPFLCVLVAVWAAVAGDDVAALVAVVAGALCLQTHLSYAVLVPTLSAVAIGATLWRGRRRRRAYAWGGGALAAGLVCWAQPVGEQLGGEGPGNLGSLITSSRDDAVHPSVALALRAVGEIVALPPAWLPTTYQNPRFAVDPPPSLLAVGVPLTILVVALGVLGWRARRRGSAPVAAGCAVALLALVAAVVSVLRMPVTLGIPFHQVAWAWPLAAVAWAAVAVAIADEVSARRAPSRPVAGDGAEASGEATPLQLPWVAGVAAAVALGAALLVVPLKASEPEYADWAMPAVDAVSGPVLAALREPAGPVLVRMPYTEGTSAVGPGLLTELQDAGIEFLVDEPDYVRQLGARRRYDGPDEATWAMTVVGIAGVAPPAEGDALVARYDAEDGDPTHYVEVFVRRLA
ncbi:MAG TPA: hypothetical protein VKA65_14455 [Acidimicrobiales bacterium]|nr:hypothetical protein [Acidimicrobiales bacterium]